MAGTLGAPGFRAFLVEIGPHAVGVVTQEDDGFRFCAFKNRFRALEDQLFDDPDAARSAALELHCSAGRELSALTSLATG
ncbi:hypothetical protein H2LOC_013500 [Methylocystis heyeri]|uniref:Uncharacterized protein n=1 Tax=Methylocystis heyeri TaxID=391905 RepID=A0A6B8KLL2_9HYPH|nr:hypothetical protein H2LOC_013500 [Methylocystis heyeri]